MHAFDYESGFASSKQRQIAEQYKQKYGEKMNFYAEMPYDVGTSLILAMKKADSIDPDKVKDVLANLQWEGLAGRTYYYGGEKKWGIKRQICRNYYLMEFKKGGKWTVASAVFAPTP
jgi:ABC-type branched-subunit amino acid transport system substrate-binding protein